MPVWVRSTRVLLPPPPGPREDRDRPSLGVVAHSFDPQILDEWIHGVLHQWSRWYWGGGAVRWYGLVEIRYETRNSAERRQFFQWIPADAVRPVHSSES